MDITTRQFEVKNAGLALNSLSIYRNILNDPLISKLYRLVKYTGSENFHLNKAVELYNCFFFELVSTSSKSFKEYMIEKILFDENPFSFQAEMREFKYIDSALKNAAANDLDLLQNICALSSGDIKKYLLKYCSTDVESSIIGNLPSWDAKHGDGSLVSRSETREPSPCFAHNESSWEPISKALHSNISWSGYIEKLSGFYRKWGCGMFARYRAFVWNSTGNAGFLAGVENPDPIALSDLISYDSERSEVIDNTLMFLKGYPANNILLYGDRGTGKSSTVKAVVNEYYREGLRIVEVQKKHLLDFPNIVRILRNRNLKFIIFVDDLAFEDNEENYTALKAALEGGLESKPQNVLIYATSNRRHLIKEKFSDRAGLQSGSAEDEIRAVDTMQEKLSLSDRFGMTVVFSSPDKSKYLEIVEGIAARRGLTADREQLHREALKWELWYNGRSPRTARQFVDWLEGHLGGRYHVYK